MKKTRRKFSSAFKTRVVLEALKERKTIGEIASKFELHPNQITKWKKEFLENADKVIKEKSPKEAFEMEKEKDELYKQIGRLKMENEWLKKKVL